MMKRVLVALFIGALFLGLAKAGGAEAGPVFGPLTAWVPNGNFSGGTTGWSVSSGTLSAVTETFPPSAYSLTTPRCEAVPGPGFTGSAGVAAGGLAIADSEPFTVPASAPSLTIDVKGLAGSGLVFLQIAPVGGALLPLITTTNLGVGNSAHAVCDLSEFAGQNVYVRIVGGTPDQAAVAFQGPLAAPQDGSAETKDPIDLSTGVFTHSHTDLFIPGRGVPLEFTRFYNPVLSRSGTLGARWTHNYEMRIEELAGGALVTYATGGTALFKLVSGSYVAPNGNFDTLTRPGLPDNTFELKTKAQGRFQFRSDGKLKKILDRNGNATTLSYDTAAGFLDLVADGSGRLLDFAPPDAQGRIVRIDDPNVTPTRSVQFEYDLAGDLTKVTDVRLGITTFTYASHRLLTIRDANGSAAPTPYDITTNVYDGYNRVDRQIDGEGKVTCIFYGIGPANTHCAEITPTPTPAQGETILVNPRGFRTTYRYDASFRTREVADAGAGLVTFAYEDPANSLSWCSTAGLNGKHRFLCSVTDQGDGATRHTTKFTYDGKGNVLSATNALNKTSEFTYTLLNDIAIEKDPLLRTTEYGYNGAGNLTSITRKDEFGVPAAPATVLGRSASGNGDLVSITDGAGHVTTFAYDANGLLDTVTDAMTPANVTNHDFDAQGRLKCLIDAEGNQTSFDYDAQNNIRFVRDAENTDFVAGTCTIAGGGADNPTEYTYYAKGNRKTVKNARGKTTTFTYDKMDRLKDVIDPLLKVTTFSYDNNGNLMARVDPRPRPAPENFVTVNYQYDTLDRLTKIDYPDDDYNVNFSYQPDGLRKCMVVAPSPTSTCNLTLNRTTYEYFADHRLKTVVDRIGTPEQATVDYTYDDAGNRKTITYPSPGPVVTYDYDAFNRMKSLRWTPNNLLTTYLYDPAGNLDTATTDLPSAADHLIADWDYDEADRLKKVTNKLGATTLSSFTYGLDGVGNRTQMTDDQAMTTSYQYDDLYRLIDANLPSTGPGAGPDSTYQYDRVGNRMSRTENGSPTSYLYDDVDRLTHQCNGDPACTVPNADMIFTYEGHGTLAHVGPNQAQGNVDNQFPLVDYDQHYLRLGHCFDQFTGAPPGAPDGVVSVGDIGVIVQANGSNETTNPGYYDPRKDVVPSSGPDGVISVGDIGGVVAQQVQSCPDTGHDLYNGDELRVTKWVGAAPNMKRTDYLWDMGAPLPAVLRERSGGVDTFYIYGLDLVASVSGATSSYYAYDALGSTTELVSTSGGVSASYRYDPFGERLSGPETGQPIRFTGEQQDADVARDPYYLRARYYDPEIGRFWSKDPWRGSTVLPQTLNGYGYVGNNPVNAADPRGLCHATACEEPGQPVPFWPPVDIEAPDIPWDFDLDRAGRRWRSAGHAVESAWDSVFGGGQDQARRRDPNEPAGWTRIRIVLSQAASLQNYIPDCRLIKNFRYARWARRGCWVGYGAVIGCFALELTAPILWGEKPPQCRP